MKDEIQTKKLDLDPHHLDYIFFLVRQLKIHIGHQIFKPIHGVPQGGIISPTLFNFAMHYFLTDLAQTINSLTETQNTPHRQITPERTGMWADDLAFIIQHLHLNSKEGQSDLKYTIRAYSHHIYTIGLSWGLRVNWKKSALMPLNLGWRSNRYASLLSHSATNPMYDPKTKSCPIILQIITGRSILQINLPLVQSYKYLGIIMTQSLRWSKHLEKLRDKAEYISICFYPLRKAATESRFAYNMWTTFIRPLLDYAAPVFYHAFSTEADKQEWFKLYRVTLKNFLHLPPNLPEVRTNKLLMYSPSILPGETRTVSEEKAKQRLLQIPTDNLHIKVNFHCHKFNWDNIPLLFLMFIRERYRYRACHYEPTGGCENDPNNDNPDHALMHVMREGEFTQKDIADLEKLQNIYFDPLSQRSDSMPYIPLLIRFYKIYHIVRYNFQVHDDIINKSITLPKI